MPELPEVETIKNVIEPQIQGLTIKKATVNRPEVIAYPTADDFCKTYISAAKLTLTNSQDHSGTIK